MVSPDRGGFIAAMEVEVQTLIDMTAFDVVPRPSNKKVISGVWAFKRKRYPDGSIRKLKARYCARGIEKIEGFDYFETHNPVIMWMSVRLLLVMSILLNFKTSYINYTTAFIHVPIACLVYIGTSVGFSTQIGDIDCVWRFNKSLYGLCQSPCNYFPYTKEKIKSKGFTQSIADLCVFCIN